MMELAPNTAACNHDDDRSQPVRDGSTAVSFFTIMTTMMTMMMTIMMTAMIVKQKDARCK